MGFQFFSVVIASFIGASIPVTAASAPPYDLRRVKGIDQFHGASAARSLLAKNGFTVSDPQWAQIYDPYIESKLPVFITTDSAWHTYHFLLEQGVREIENVQAQRLVRFSRGILNAARFHAAAGHPDFAALAEYASVGLALQDASHRETCEEPARQTANTLRSGSGTVQTPAGLPLDASRFRAISFYTQSAVLADYFAAHQWYGGVVFRLNDPAETRLALMLAWLIDSDAELRSLFDQLTAPYDTMLGPVDDADVRAYAVLGKRLLGTEFGPVAIQARLEPLRSELRRVINRPRVSDQLLDPVQHSRFEDETRGFRLLAPRREPSAVCFEESMKTATSKRSLPSGLDFFVASPTLRSAASVKALKSQFGQALVTHVSRIECEPFPESRHGDALKLLALLQQPVPRAAPAAMRTPAWSDKQLNAQLAAWAEQRHTWALHIKINQHSMGLRNPPPGMVEPYPDFFSGLAKLARDSATALNDAGLRRTFDVRSFGADLLKQIGAYRRLQQRSADEETEGMDWRRLGAVLHERLASMPKTGDRAANMSNVIAKIEGVAARAAKGDPLNTSEAALVEQFAHGVTTIPERLVEFGGVCEQLATIARKQLAGEQLTQEEHEWIGDYGPELAGFHDTTASLDDFPIVTPVFVDPRRGSVLYAGVGRPETLYIIMPHGGVLWLYVGAVLSYREFPRPDNEPLDDTAWRALISEGKAPPPPPFTRSFRAEASGEELIRDLWRTLRSEDGDYTLPLEQLEMRAADGDVGKIIQLISVLVKHDGDPDLIDDLAEIVARLDWKSNHAQLLKLLHGSKPAGAGAAAYILSHQPETLDALALAREWARQAPGTRRLYCCLFGRLPKQLPETRDILIAALADSDPRVRWQATTAITRARLNERGTIDALVRTLNDTNEIIAAGAAIALGRAGATNTGPLLLATLRTRLSLSLQTPNPVPRHASHSRVVYHDEFTLRRTEEFLTEDDPHYEFRFGGRDFNSALIEALGDLLFAPARKDLEKLAPSTYAEWAVAALEKFEPGSRLDRLIAVASNRKAAGAARLHALGQLQRPIEQNRLRELLPLLDDASVINRNILGPLRVCDMAADAIAAQMGRSGRASNLRTISERDQFIDRVRAWATE